MLIIVEGVDCSGKTVLINQLMRRATNAFHIRRSDIPKSADSTEIGRLKRSYKIIKDLYRKVVQPNHGHLIVERYYPSELVYSKVKRGYEAFDDSFYRSFEKDLIECIGDDIILLHVFQEIKTLRKRLLERGDKYINEEELSDLNMRYVKFLEWTHLHSYSVPGSKDGTASAINHLNLFCSNDFKNDLTPFKPEN